MSSPLTYRCPSRESPRSWSCESNSAVPERWRDVPVVHALTLVGSVRVQGISEVQIQEKKSGLHHSLRGPSLDGQVNALSPGHTSAATRLGPDFTSKIQVNPSAAPGPRKFRNWTMLTARKPVRGHLSWGISNVGAVCKVNISQPSVRDARPLGGAIKCASIWAACPADSDRVAHWRASIAISYLISSSSKYYIRNRQRVQLNKLLHSICSNANYRVSNLPLTSP